MIFIMLLCVFMLERFFTKENKTNKKNKTSGVIIVCSGLEKVSFIFYLKERIGNSLTIH